MITNSGYNIRVWQDKINGELTLSVKVNVFEGEPDEECIAVTMNSAERDELRLMLDVYMDKEAN